MLNKHICSAILYIILGILYILIYVFYTLFNKNALIKGGNNKNALIKGGNPPCNCIPYDIVHRITNPDFHINEIKHPNGFTMQLIDESHLPGGSKQRIITHTLKNLPIEKTEVVYAGPKNGYAQVALSYCCRMLGKKATIFVDATQHDEAPLTNNAKLFNGNIKYIKPNIREKLKHIQNTASKYVSENRSRYLIPFGMNNPESIQRYITAFKPLKSHFKTDPKRIWIVAGSGLIFNALGKMFPTTKLMIVQVGKKIWPDQLAEFNHELFISDLHFNQNIPPPLPPYNTKLSYDGKLWPFVLKHGQPGDVIWNTAGEPWNAEQIANICSEIESLLQTWSQIETQTVKESKTMNFPYQHSIMQPPLIMFEKFKNEITPDSTYNKSEIRRDFSINYYETDGLSNHFTEPQRMDCIVNTRERISPRDFWNAKRDQIAIQAFKMGHGTPQNFTPDWIESIRSLSSFKECTTFNPFILLYTINKYLPNKKIRMLDPSMGWGDRLIGALACNITEYTGFDPNETLHPSYKKITSVLPNSTTTNFLPHRFKLKTLAKYNIPLNFDLAFTSPPYFDFEIYKGSEHDIQNGYPTWLQTLYTPYLQDMVNAVKPGGYIAIYTSNIGTATLGNDTKHIVSETGATFIETLNFFHDHTDIDGVTRKGSPRPLYIFRKT